MFALFDVTVAILLAFLLILTVRIQQQKNRLKKIEADALTGQFIANCCSEAVITLSVTGEILDVNSALLDFLEIRREEIVGFNATDPAVKQSDPELFKRILKAAGDGENSSGNPFTYDYVDSEGYHYPTEVHTFALGSPRLGKSQIICILKEMGSKRDEKRMLARQKALEHVIGSLVSKAFSDAGAEEDIPSLLGLAGEFMNARRAFLFQLKKNTEEVNWTALWDSNDVPAMDDDWYRISGSTVRRFFVSEDNDYPTILKLFDNPELPEYFLKPAQKNSIGSVVAMPLALHGEDPFGFVGFAFAGSNPSIDESATLLLNVAAEILTGLLAKSEANREKALFRKCVDAAGQGIALIDSNGLPYYTNAAYRELTGIQDDDKVPGHANPRLANQLSNPAAGQFAGPLATPVWKYYHGSYEDKVGKFILPLVRSGERWTGELAIKRGENKKITTLESFFPIEQTGAHPALVAVIITNINSRKRMEQQLTQARKTADLASREKSNYLASMSHEIRTPMNAVIGLTYLTLQTKLDRRQRDYLTKVNSAAQNLLNLINDILDLSKIESGKMELEYSPFTIDAVLENLANLTLEQAIENDIELLFHRTMNTNGFFMGDPLRIGQVLSNLLSNAIKFSAGGRVTVSVELTHPGYFRFRVRDTGTGIAPEQLEKLFEPFHQAEISTSRRYGGTGLGLPICKRLVELMDGTIDVESELGNGSSFWFELRLDRPETPIGPEPPPLPEKLKGTDAFSIAADSLKREIHSRFLSFLGFRVTSCASIKDALESPIHPALIILDIDVCNNDPTSPISALSVGENPPPIVLLSGTGGYDALETIAPSQQPEQILPLPYSSRQLKIAILGEAEPNRNGEPRASTTHQGTSTARGRILVAEDDEFNQQVVLELLSQTGLIVDIAEDGSQAVSMAIKHPYNIVLLDVHMPVMDGYEAAAAIRQKKRNLPIVAMTASALGTIRTQLRESAFNDYLSKPIEPESLYRIIAKALSIPVVLLKQRMRSNSSISDEKLNIQGLDEDAGIGFVLGNHNRYRQMLNRFTKRFAGFTQLVDTAIKANEPRQLLSRVHELRGAAGSIGAEKLKESAGRLEEKLRLDGKAGAAELKELVDSLDALVSQISEKINHRASINVADTTNTRRNPFLDQLEDLVRHSDPAALNFLEELSNNQEHPDTEKWREQIRIALIHVDYDSALNLIDEWRSAGDE